MIEGQPFRNEGKPFGISDGKSHIPDVKSEICDMKFRVSADTGSHLDQHRTEFRMLAKARYLAVEQHAELGHGKAHADEEPAEQTIDRAGFIEAHFIDQFFEN